VAPHAVADSSRTGVAVFLGTCAADVTAIGSGEPHGRPKRLRRTRSASGQSLASLRTGCGGSGMRASTGTVSGRADGVNRTRAASAATPPTNS
jgi:hypothetical protein